MVRGRSGIGTRLGLRGLSGHLPKQRTPIAAVAKPPDANAQTAEAILVSAPTIVLPGTQETLAGGGGMLQGRDRTPTISVGNPLPNRAGPTGPSVRRATTSTTTILCRIFLQVPSSFGKERQQHQSFDPHIARGISLPLRCHGVRKEGLEPNHP